MTNENERTYTLEELTLANTVQEIETHVAQGGWDGPPRVFAIIRTKEALETTPELASQMPELLVQLEANELSMLSIEQEGLPDTETLEEPPRPPAA